MLPALSPRQHDFLLRLALGAAITFLFFPLYGDTHPWMIAGLVVYPIMIGLALLAFYKLPPSSQRSAQNEPLSPREERGLRLIKITNLIPIFWTLLLAFSLLVSPQSSQQQYTVARKEVVEKRGQHNQIRYAYTLFNADNKAYALTKAHYERVMPEDTMLIYKAFPLPLTTKLTIFRDNQPLLSDGKDYGQNMALLGIVFFFCLSPYTAHRMPRRPVSFRYGMRRSFYIGLRLFIHFVLAIPLIGCVILLISS